jgi:hypothetical protein
MEKGKQKSMKGDNMKTFFEVAFEVLGCAVLVIGMITIFVGAVLQKRTIIENR